MDQIQPMPVPTQWGVDFVQSGTHIVLIAFTHQGQQVHFIGVESVDGLCEAMQASKAQAQAAQNGGGHIEVPASVVLGPDGQPIKVVPPSPDVVEAMAKARHPHAMPEGEQGGESTGGTGDSDG